MAITFTLGEIAAAVDARLIGDPATPVTGLQTLAAAGGSDVSFLANKRYRAELATTAAAAVLIEPAFVDECPVAALVTDTPYLAYARLTHRFEQRPAVAKGVHPTATVDPSAEVAADASIGPGVVIGAGVSIAAGVEIGPGCVIGDHSVIGEQTRLAARVTLYHAITLGRRNLIHSGVVIGADGFGFAPSPEGWQKIAQLGGVVTGDDVEIGANTTIDRGALEPTRIGNGVKIDNQVQIAHNCEIGDNSAIAGCAGIAGSTKIGQRCTIAGAAGIAGHLEIADDVHVSGMAMVTNSLNEKGIYSSGTGILPYQQWKRNVVRFRQLDKLAGRVAALEASAEKKQKG
nr:UDP-3-O-(3-hydroxymyristoyl)glucosamine N-acyltransferase [Motiliproteus sediminis]